MIKRIKSGGRKKGIPNVATAAKAAEVAASGLTPVDFMISVMRDETADPQHRMDMAKAVAPYIHPRLAATVADVTVNVDNRSDQSDAERKLDVARRILFIVAQAEDAMTKLPAPNAHDVEGETKNRR